MEKFAIEIETAIGWVNYHVILRPEKERAMTVLSELKEKYPNANFRVVRWLGEPLSD